MLNNLKDMMASDVQEINVVKVGDNALKSVSSLAEKAIALEDEIISLEELIKKKKSDYRFIVENDLPETMREVGVPSFKTSDGSAINISIVTRASPSVDKRGEAYQWLRENNLGDIIKTEVKISFPAGEENSARELVNKLNSLEGDKNKVDFEERIHPQTLLAFVRRRLESGKPLPRETFGVWQGTVAKITRAKK